MGWGCRGGRGRGWWVRVSEDVAIVTEDDIMNVQKLVQRWGHGRPFVSHERRVYHAEDRSTKSVLVRVCTGRA